MIKAFIFDLGGVVVDNPSEDFLKYFSKCLKVKPKVLKKIFSIYKKSFQKGKITEKTLWNKISKHLNIEIENKYIWEKAASKVIKKRKKILNLIKLLRKIGYKTAILSNTEKPTVKYLIKKGYDKFFDVVVFSCEVGFVKPEQEIYKIVLKKLKIKPQQAIFIDDVFEFVKAARKLGIRGIVFRNYKHLLKNLGSFLK